MTFPDSSNPPFLLLLATAVATLAAIAIHHFYCRQPWIQRTKNMPETITKPVSDLCHASRSVSTLLAEDPALAPGEAASQLYSTHPVSVLDTSPPKHRRVATPEELGHALSCGNFGDVRPSELFLRIWHDALCTLDHDPLAGVVSPPLMGSSGILPLTVISALPDICRHMSNLIARAEHEVILATNYWKESNASRLITDSLKELSKRAGRRKRRAVVKIIYDRGSAKQVFDNHLDVSESERTAPGVGLPSADEIPNIDIEVINYHRPVLGTFHAKFMVVDRKIGIVCSNNIQDNDNLEMMTHLEGPIVDSLYDMALLTWHDALKPPLPLLTISEAQSEARGTFDSSFLDIASQTPANRTNLITRARDSGVQLPENEPGDPHYDEDMASELLRMQAILTPTNGESVMSLVTKHLNEATQQKLQGTAPECAPEDTMTPYIPHARHEPFPIALVNRKPWGALNHSSVYTPQNEAWLSAIRNAESTVFIQSPDINAEPLIPALLDAVRRGVEVTMYACLGYNDLGELLPFQGGTNEMISHKMYTELDPDQRKRLHIHWYVGKDQTKPLHNKFKQRSCHIKLMIVDEHIGIQGSGNQDTQSWYHSQEVNILLDSPEICADWVAGLRRNQNTHLYGAVSQEDGIWRDDDGNEAKGAIGINPGHMSWAKGVVGAVKRVKGDGGF
ncbi:Phospholipase D/Transphosphatidylase [Lasiodiplodia theobromae]|uniref:Phospholipase D/Transphosphatidylase n=1 Tax=Lasiodiplodia theobromae TaxID=45133 RepID=UPI0015C36FC0|nr:Phospholipase D/Transphosphatidylase [Lasiodiplodia theobromae]KAF4544133.1 Phospholipase D/Transphosphatidylase [Lasiodiplodia theobromae]